MGVPSLSEIVAPSRTALVTVEVQHGVIGADSVLGELAQSAEKMDLVPRLSRLAGAARAAGVPVIHLTAETLPGGWGANRNARLFGAVRKRGPEKDGLGAGPARLPAGLDPDDADLILPRYHGLSPLTGTEVDSLLRNAGVSTIVVTGVSLNVAIPNLVFDAVNRSYQVVVVTDAVAGVPPEYGDQVLRHTLAVLATLTTADELAAAWAR